MLEEIKRKLAEFTELCGTDEEKLRMAKLYADDLNVVENLAPELMKNGHYAKAIADLEESLKNTKNRVLYADLNMTASEAIRADIARHQTLRATLRELRGRDREEFEALLDRSIAALKEEKEMTPA